MLSGTVAVQMLIPQIGLHTDGTCKTTLLLFLVSGATVVNRFSRNGDLMLSGLNFGLSALRASLDGAVLLCVLGQTCYSSNVSLSTQETRQN